MEKKTAVEWLQMKMTTSSTQEMVENINVWFAEAKAMEKEQIIDAINKVSENNVKYANMIIASWSQIEGELFMHNTKLAEQYYNETFKSK